MKRVLAALCASVLVVSAIVFAGDDMKAGSMEKAPWFDFKNCAFCQPWIAEEGLMEHIAWESKPIATGMINVSVVEPEFEAAYERAHAAMMVKIEKAMAGEMMHACGQCTALMGLAKDGAMMENMDVKTTHILSVTSADPAIAKRAQEVAKQNVEEMKKMMAMEGEK